ncbi:hypothetical protein [Nonomuraea maheshkhaliensis]
MARALGLVTAGAAVGGVLAGGGFAAARQFGWTGFAVTVVTESRSLSPGVLATNVVCPRGQRAVSGGYAYYGDHNREEPVTVEVNAPEDISDPPDGVPEAWSLVLLSSKKKRATVEVHAVCVPR